MTKITENAIALLAIEKLETIGYQYLYAPDFVPDALTSERAPAFHEPFLAFSSIFF